MEFGIKGHQTRGDEVIKLLEMLGGCNCCNLTGGNDNNFYYISYEYKYISNSYIGPDEIKGYEIFSLEDFLEKFPYKVGDKVTLDNKLCSIIWMCWECNNIYYQVQGEDLMFAKKVMANELKPYNEKNTNMNIESDLANDDEKPQIDPTIDYYEIMLNDFYDGLKKRQIEITMDTLYKTGTTHDFLKERGFNLPEGFHFTDENGNVIEAKKILLVKNTPYYPTTYKECCELLGCKSIIGFAGLDDEEENLYGKFIALKRCRDAYWKIAGEYLELDKPWEPDWTNENQPKYGLYNELKYSIINPSQFVFPTIEMRDEFHNNFKNLIEQCKELL